MAITRVGVSYSTKPKVPAAPTNPLLAGGTTPQESTNNAIAALISAIQNRGSSNAAVAAAQRQQAEQTPEPPPEPTEKFFVGITPSSNKSRRGGGVSFAPGYGTSDYANFGWTQGGPGTAGSSGAGSGLDPLIDELYRQKEAKLREESDRQGVQVQKNAQLRGRFAGGSLAKSERELGEYTAEQLDTLERERIAEQLSKALAAQQLDKQIAAEAKQQQAALAAQRYGIDTEADLKQQQLDMEQEQYEGGAKMRNAQLQALMQQTMLSQQGFLSDQQQRMFQNALNGDEFALKQLGMALSGLQGLSGNILDQNKLDTATQEWELEFLRQQGIDAHNMTQDEINNAYRNAVLEEQRKEREGNLDLGNRRVDFEKEQANSKFRQEAAEREAELLNNTYAYNDLQKTYNDLFIKNQTLQKTYDGEKDINKKEALWNQIAGNEDFMDKLWMEMAGIKKQGLNYGVVGKPVTSDQAILQDNILSSIFGY